MRGALSAESALCQCYSCYRRFHGVPVLSTQIVRCKPAVPNDSTDRRLSPMLRAKRSSALIEHLSDGAEWNSRSTATCRCRSRTQLRALIEYGIACGELAAGRALPSVRELAERIGVAPMTVSQVYARPEGRRADRDAAGLRHLRRRQRRTPGSRAAAEAAELHRRIDDADRRRAARWASGRPSSSRWSTRASSTATHRRPQQRLVVVGLFTDAPRSYARFIAGRARRRRDGRAG